MMAADGGKGREQKSGRVRAVSGGLAARRTAREKPLALGEYRQPLTKALVRQNLKIGIFTCQPTEGGILVALLALPLALCFPGTC